jgi:hypothetical protein
MNPYSLDRTEKFTETENNFSFRIIFFLKTDKPAKVKNCAKGV